MSQEKLAELSGMGSKGYVSDLESGKRRYNADHLKAFGHALDCEPQDIVNINPLIWYAEKLPDNVAMIVDQVRRVPEGRREEFIDTTMAALERLRAKPARRKPVTSKRKAGA